ncbi:alpha/beta fold hydrolase [Aurantimonas sp. VKM B-3413]|uniref:alpha/beta fold hydrolase n=1 Tax=Aurantimonas sp. VKM B-3413 TaxID=2779401 RepID=UPI001E3F30F6|nr:alpha/beta hydrolase [Aurantimonas sp. VKM B-3413]
MEIDGVRLHYVESGSGEPVVFLHGNGSLIQDFVTSGLVRLVAQTHRVIVFDRPGYGYSERPRSRKWSPAAQADLLAKAAEQLGAGRAHLLGHSWGTLVALEWALRHPESVRNLTLASGYYYPTPRVDVVLAAGPAVPLLGDVMRYTITPMMARLMWPMLLRKLFGPAPTSAHFKDVPRALILSPRALRASAEESAMMIPAAASLQGRYANLKAPLLLVTGDGDRIVDFRHQSRRLHEQLPGSRLVVLEGVGHMVHQTKPQKISEAMRETEDTEPVAN